MTTPQDDILRTQFLHEQKQTRVWDLTKREWFAGMALQGIIVKLDFKMNLDSYAEDAYKFADAMIRAEKG